ELQYFAAHIDGDFLREVAGGDCRRHFGDVADLASQVAGHEIYVVGEVFPGSADTWYLRLASEFAFGTDFAGDARDFAGECVELVHHGIDGVFEFENFSFNVDGDFAGKIATGYGGGYLGDVSNLRRQVSGHRVD